MKLLNILPLAAVGTSFVLPDQEVLNADAVWNLESSLKKATENIPSAAAEAWGDLDQTITRALGCARHKFSDAVDTAFGKATEYGRSFEEAFDYTSWLEYTEDAFDPLMKPPKHPDHPDHPKHPKHPKRPHHPPPHHDKPNQTVYELISQSKYTTVLAKLINEYPDLVETLNGTAANYTVFAPTDKAFEKIPKHAPKPSKEDLKKILTYHVSPEFYPAGRILVTRTIPTLYNSPALGDEAQRISTQIGLRGISVNYYSRVVAVNIFGTNGVIHGIDSILVPPPKVITILKFLVGEFSTLDLALEKTGLSTYLNDTSLHVGGTAFAPTNAAFRKLGPKLNAFLFSKYGEKYLTALLKYHLVPNYTLYSDALYKGEPKDDDGDDQTTNDGHHRIPKGRYHIDLPTGLKDKSLAIDIVRWGRAFEIRINGYSRVAVVDGIAKDGVIHVVNSVLIPPKKPGLLMDEEEELSVEELMQRLEPYLDTPESAEDDDSGYDFEDVEPEEEAEAEWAIEL